MVVTACDIPAGSVVRHQLAGAPWFQDSYRAPQTHLTSDMAAIFLALFAHHPGWIKAVLIMRNCIAGWCGLAVPSAASILHPAPRAHYAVGDVIGPWPIYVLTEHELVAGRDNRHLDFRLSVLREMHDGGPSVVVSTICSVHNVAGKIYLFFIVPFHKWGVKRLIARAVAAGRL